MTLTDNQIVDLLRYSDTKFGGRTFQEADRDHAFPRFWRAAYCEMYRRSQTNQELINAALDALVWLKLFEVNDGVRSICPRTRNHEETLQEAEARLVRAIAELERVTASLEWKETPEK